MHGVGLADNECQIPPSEDWCRHFSKVVKDAENCLFPLLNGALQLRLRQPPFHLRSVGDVKVSNQELQLTKILYWLTASGAISAKSENITTDLEVLSK